MSNKSLQRGMLQILAANVLNMLFSIGTNFLLPKFLSVDSYSQIKTYQLYVTYVAILHFGYNDGMYLKYGGKELNEIGDEEVGKNISTLRLFQLAIMFLCIVVAFFIKDFALIFAAMTILPQNMIAYFKNLYSAIGEFDKYSRIINLTTGMTFAINVILIAFVKTDNYILFLICYVVLNAVMWLLLEAALIKLKPKTRRISFSFKELKESVSGGILLLLGNYASVLLTSMDRWFIKFLMDSVAFAEYSFAVSMENFLTVAMTPVTVTMYNYFCNNDTKEKITGIQELVVAFSAVIIASAFPIKFVLEYFLQDYYSSSMVIFVLFAAQMFCIIIKSVYINLYKARKQQKKYFIKLSAVIAIAFVFNVICYAMVKRIESFAVGTLLATVVWFVMCRTDFKEICFSIKLWFYVFVEAGVFIACGIYLNSVAGCVLYVIVTLIMLAICIPNAYRKLFAVLKGFKSKIKQ